MVPKERIKRILMARLHAVDAQKYDIIHAVASKGVEGYLDFDYSAFREDILLYVNSLRVGEYGYKYAKSCSESCLYASIYAVMLQGLLGELSEMDLSMRKGWIDHLNSYQSKDDGLYYDDRLRGNSYEHIGPWNEGWGKHHLMGHIIIALCRLGGTPKYPLSYLAPFYDADKLVAWMNGFDFDRNSWTVSNYFMNLYSVLQYSRDYLNDTKAAHAVEVMAEWLYARQNKETGMWHSKRYADMTQQEKLEAVRAAYHYFPLFSYDNIRLPYTDKTVESILPLQNSWGGWTLEGFNSGACEDIDAIDPLVRFANSEENNEAVQRAVKKSLIWQMACRNADKGFSFYVRSRHEYGGHPLTTSLRDESSLFATWFRTLCIAYEMNFLGISNSFDMGRFPGYEIKI